MQKTIVMKMFGFLPEKSFFGSKTDKFGVRDMRLHQWAPIVNGHGLCWWCHHSSFLIGQTESVTTIPLLQPSPVSPIDWFSLLQQVKDGYIMKSTEKKTPPDKKVNNKNKQTKNTKHQLSFIYTTS